MEIDRPMVAYCCVSTLEQKRRGYGIEIQIRDVQAFAERQGLLVVRFYRDEAESGIKEDRKQLRRLLEDCRASRVGSVILPTLDRLSRDVRIAENLFHEFEQLGDYVLIPGMPMYNGRDRKDALVRQIREAIAGEDRKDIIERLWKGRQERVRRGFPPGGSAPSGFRRINKAFVLDTAESDIARTIFDLQARGKKSSEIARTLSAKDHRLRNGGSWTQRRVAAPPDIPANLQPTAYRNASARSRYFARCRFSLRHAGPLDYTYGPKVGLALRLSR
jgi:site-specific DNA recombinase